MYLNYYCHSYIINFNMKSNNNSNKKKITKGFKKEKSNNSNDNISNLMDISPGPSIKNQVQSAQNLQQVPMQNQNQLLLNSLNTNNNDMNINMMNAPPFQNYQQQNFNNNINTNMMNAPPIQNYQQQNLNAPQMFQQQNLNAPQMFQQQNLNAPQMFQQQNLNAAPMNLQQKPKYNTSNKIKQSLNNNYNNQTNDNFDTIQLKDDPLLTTPTKTPSETKDNKRLKTIKDKVHLSMRLKNKQIKIEGKIQKIPLLVTLTADENENVEKTAIDLVCVLDISGSMMGTKIELLKSTFPVLLDLLTEADRLSIVIFNNSAKKITPLLRMDNKGKELTLKQINKIRSNGGTSITNGMLGALEILNNREQENVVTGVFLLSDGLDGSAQSGVKSLVQGYNQKKMSCNYSLNTFGFGYDHDPKLMGSIAELKEGNFYFIEKLDQVDEAFGDCLIGLQSIIAQNVEIKIQPKDSNVFKGVRITEALGVAGTWKEDTGVYYTSIKQLISDKSRNFVLELEIPATKNMLSDLEKTMPLIVANAQASLTGLVESGTEFVTLSSDLTAFVLDDSDKMDPSDLEEDEDVMFNYLRVKFAMVMDSCKKNSDQGKYDKSSDMLNQFKKDICSSKLNKNEKVITLTKDIDEAISVNSPSNYQLKGKHYMVQNINCFNNEMSNNCNNINFMNSNQVSYNYERVSKKSGK